MASGPEVPNSSVWPWAAARATYSAPMLPPAPARFSTTMVWPSRSFIEAASVRAIASVGPPGGKGTTSVIGLSARLSAWAGSRGRGPGPGESKGVGGGEGAGGGGGASRCPTRRQRGNGQRVARQHAVQQDRLRPADALLRAATHT